MLPDVAQEVHEALLDEPVGVVQDQRLGGPRIEVEQPCHLVALEVHVFARLLLREQGAFTGFAARVPDEAGAAAHQRDRSVTGQLEMPQQHDRHEIAELQAGSGGIEPAVDGAATSREVGVQVARGVVHEAAPLELGNNVRHGAESYENPQPLASARRPH